MVKILVTLSLFILPFFYWNTVQASTEVVINEAMAEPDGEGEWVELYFPDSIFELAGYYFKDAKDNKKNIQDVQNCGNFAVFELSPTTYWLNNDTSTDKESIILYDQSGTEIDSRKDWENPGKGKSIGRTPDGADNWNQTENPTKCAANAAAYQEAQSPSTAVSPSPTPSASTKTAVSSPGTSPVKSPSPKAQANPSGTNTSAKQAVLGSSTQSPQETVLNISDPNTSPSPSPSPQETTSSKYAGYLVAAGAIVLTVSMALFLWYKWEIKGSRESQDIE